jgi:hypothetical protein
MFGVVLFFTAAVAGGGTGAPDNPGKPDFDLRLPERIEDRGGFVMRQPGPVRETALALFVAAHPGARFRWDGMSGSPKWIGAARGDVLSPPVPGAPEQVARAFVAAHADLFGLQPIEVRRLRMTSSVTSDTGASSVYFTQTVGGLDTFDGRLQVNLRGDGAVSSVSSTIYAGLQPPPQALISPSESVARAVADVYPDVPFTEVLQSAVEGVERKTVFEKGEFGFEPSARLIVLPTAEASVLVWEVLIGERTLRTSYRILIDAADGTILFRQNTTEYADARYLNSARPLPKTEEFEPDDYILATIPSSTPESPSGWISGAGTALAGNNAVTNLGWRDEPGLSEPSGVYDYPFNTTRSALVTAWWWTNDFHDWLYARGYDEQAGNYQEDNFAGGGVGGDPLEVVATEGAPRGDAWFGPSSIDGNPSWINFTWVRCRFCGDHDGLPGMDGDTVGERHGGYLRAIVIHEYMHGVSHRRVGGPGDNTCLGQTQSDAMGESWGDMIARSITGILWAGTYEGTGINRRFEHDLTYGDLCQAADTGCQEHVDGLIFSAAVWDLRKSMEALDPQNGAAQWDQLIIESLRLTPCDPSMLDARDAILQADDDLYALAHEDLIWHAFANRGMGNDASTTGAADTAPVPGFAVPAGSACTPPGMPTGVSAAPEGSNAIRVSYTATGSSAVEIWREDLDNPLDRPANIGSTNDLSSFLDTDVQGGKSYRYHVVGLGNGGIPCRSTTSATADGMATGSCDAYPIFVPNLTATDGAADCAVTLNWSAASEGCPGAGDPIVYNIYRAPTPGYDPSERLLIGRTTSTTFQDTPPENNEYPFVQRFDPTAHYMVLAQHGTLADAPDHRYRGSSQILDWEPVVPTLGRTLEHSWDFESGAQGWTTDNTNDPVGGWVVADPTPTTYGNMPLAPEAGAGGSGMAWVTGEGVGNIADHDCNATTLLTSPVWDGSNGATIFSYDYWAVGHGNYWFGLEVRIDNGTDVVRVATVGLRTAQPFETDDAHSWQREELNLARWVTPTSTMSVTFASFCGWPFGELGIDNVRVESATRCGRSGLRVDSVTVDDSPAGWGNGNGVLEPGETARLHVRLENAGSVTAVAPGGVLTSRTPTALVHESSADFPDIPAGGTGDVLGNGFTVTAPATGDCDDSLVFDFQFTDSAGTLSYANWNPELGNTVTDVVFEDTFETDKGWIVQGLVSRGRWQRGDPVGTTNGADQANPENDSPNDAGAQCYVTENGLVGGAAALTDVDRDLTGLIWPTLASPWLDLSAYKRATVLYDMWLYDDSSATPNQDYLQIFGDAQVGNVRGDGSTFRTGNPSGWVSVSEDLTRLTPLTAGNRVRFVAFDNAPDHIVEVGVDNVSIQGHYQVCDPLGVNNPPNGIGNTLGMAKRAGELEASWTASPIDGTHDGAAYYQLWVSGAPDAGFAVVDTSTETTLLRPLGPGTEFCRVVAVNPAGTSGDEPAP